MQSVPAAAGSGPMPTSGQWGQYEDHEGRQYRRVSTLIKKVETDTYNLDLWKLRQVAEGLAIRDDLVFAVKAMGRPPAEGWTREQKKTLNGIAKTAAEVAKTGKGDGAKIGTAFHTLTERVDRGEDIERLAAGLPAAAGETIRAYAALRELNRWESIEIERSVHCEELDVVGTFDRVDLVPGLAAMLGPGVCQHASAHHGHADEELPVIVDVKTEESPWMNGLHIGPQLAIYSRAKRMWLPPGEYVPAPCVRQDVAVVVHLRDGRARPYFIDLDEGWDAAVAAYAQLLREQRAKRKLGVKGAWFAAVPGIVEPPVAQLLVQQAAASDYANPSRPAAHAPGDTVTAGDVEFLPGIPAGAEQVAVRGEDGLVRWEAAGQNADADKAKLAGMLIEQIWRTDTVAGLGTLWTMARDHGVRWDGAVRLAGDARQRQIECKQRAMHAPAFGGKCACGWTPEILP